MDQTTLDIALMRRVILGISDTFPNGNWRFLPSNWDFDDPTQPLEHANSRGYSEISLDQLNQNFIGIKIGDVNGTWTPLSATEAE